MLAKFLPLPLSMPATLPAAFGYPLNATHEAHRFFGAYWEPGGDELMITDGANAYTSAIYEGWIAFHNHPLVAPLWGLLQDRGMHFGSSEEPATHILIVDRVEQKLYAASINEGRSFLATQHPRRETVRLTRHEWEQLAAEITKKMRGIPAPSQEEIIAVYQASVATVQAMIAELDALLVRLEDGVVAP